jgi:hypothetical protein
VESARDLQAACAALLPGYDRARRSGPFRPCSTIRDKRHLAARGNAQRVLLDSADGETHQRLARQARSWGVELSA